MIDAEEAEAEAQAVADAEKSRVQATPADVPAILPPGTQERLPPGAQERREMKRPSLDPQPARLQRQERGAGRAKRAPEWGVGADQIAPNVSEIPKVLKPEGQSSPSGGESARSLRAVAKEERRAAKHAAQVLAALEKREARERKALAKAAARRQPKGIFRT